MYLKLYWTLVACHGIVEIVHSLKLYYIALLLSLLYNLYLPGISVIVNVCCITKGGSNYTTEGDHLLTLKYLDRGVHFIVLIYPRIAGRLSDQRSSACTIEAV